MIATEAQRGAREDLFVHILKHAQDTEVKVFEKPFDVIMDELVAHQSHVTQKAAIDYTFAFLENGCDSKEALLAHGRHVLAQTRLVKLESGNVYEGIRTIERQISDDLETMINPATSGFGEGVPVRFIGSFILPRRIAQKLNDMKTLEQHRVDLHPKNPV